MENLENKLKLEHIIKDGLKDPTIYDLCFYICNYYYPIISKMEKKAIKDRFLKDVSMLNRLLMMHYHNPIKKTYNFPDDINSKLPELMVTVYNRVIRHIILSN